MPGFNTFKQQLDDIKGGGLLISPKIEKAVEEYQRKAEEAELLCLEQEAKERHEELSQNVPARNLRSGYLREVIAREVMAIEAVTKAAIAIT